MRTFSDEKGADWVATALEENTARHHGRWFLVFHPDAQPTQRFPMPEVRWQTQATARRTLLTMSEFELRRRLNSVLARTSAGEGGPAAEVVRSATNVSAG